jgi:hypothetical protein
MCLDKGNLPREQWPALKPVMIGWKVVRLLPEGGATSSDYDFHFVKGENTDPGTIPIMAYSAPPYAPGSKSGSKQKM